MEKPSEKPKKIKKKRQKLHKTRLIENNDWLNDKKDKNKEKWIL